MKVAEATLETEYVIRGCSSWPLTHEGGNSEDTLPRAITQSQHHLLFHLRHSCSDPGHEDRSSSASLRAVLKAPQIVTPALSVFWWVLFLFLQFFCFCRFTVVHFQGIKDQYYGFSRRAHRVFFFLFFSLFWSRLRRRALCCAFQVTFGWWRQCWPQFCDFMFLFKQKTHW